MMDHPIAMAIPSKIEHCGVCYHGLWLSPPLQFAGGSASYYLSDMEVVTRGGRHIKPWHGAAYAEAIRFLQELGPTSRPFLYMHPSAQHDAEDEKGIDRSGYCIFYGASGGRRTPTYLSGYAIYGVRLAYTPDSQGQAIPFSFHDRYIPPILVGARGSGLLSDVETLTHESRELCSVSTDGRLRLYARFPTGEQVRAMRRWYEGTDDPFPSGATYEPQAASYALSGEYGEIVATPVDVVQPTYNYTSDSQLDVGERLDTIAISFLGLGPGGCYPPGADVTPTTRVHRSPVSWQPDYQREYEKATSDIDVCADAASPTYLTYSYETENIVTHADSATGHAENTLGGDCSLGGDERGQKVVSWSSHSEVERTNTLTIRRRLELSGWGQESSAAAEYFQSNTRKVVRETSGGEVVYDVETETYDFERSLSVQLDGQVVLSRQGWGSAGGGDTLFPWPRVLTYVQRSTDLLFACVDNENGVVHEGARYAAAQLIEFGLSAGVHALACVVTEGTLKSVSAGGWIDPETARVRVFIGRIFGFGISAPGRELTEDEMNSDKLFIAYDPLEKKFSDIYTHPVFYQ